ncbi:MULTISPECIES: DUF952 domain-containing protein [unclassified Beijerinckia]|uniref:DUF952 domain-containing protein n=1 Tax=unclassified Beijerinckia TaxID=2638183 RepID=UPI0008980FDB|nr:MULTISPECIES: DUF952 domain-containing protein [unclassified Beijerinckia]MDH7796659.1 uncharacterized protein (DUF952 family) [Beijerinckia sp. GAS462]SEC54534.1 Uncharacterized conserved protein, DUF952 family [Beijerinckia sp. 28-YEA-48]
MQLIYKISTQEQWDRARECGFFAGAPVDLADGFIHFSTADQALETAAKHFAGQSGLVLAALDADALGVELKWEPSRGGQLFPHLYRPFAVSEVIWAKALPLDATGAHDFAGLLP